MKNDPLRYTDPTGHKAACGEYGEECGDDELDALTGGNGGGGGESSGGSNGNGREEGNGGSCPGLCAPTSQPSLSDDWGWQFSTAIYLESFYCGNGPNGSYNFFDCIANGTQDLALAIDVPFAFGELVLITAGCFAGPEGCLIGAGVADTIFNVTGANAGETVLSLVSMVSSIAADYADDNHFGESAVTVGVAGVGGFFSPDPLIDFTIDGFGSAYNHDVNPISNLPSLIGSLFSP